MELYIRCDCGNELGYEMDENDVLISKDETFEFFVNIDWITVIKCKKCSKRIGLMGDEADDKES